MADNSREIYPNSYLDKDKEDLRLEKSNISKSNKELIKGWLKYLKSTGTGSKRLFKLSLQLRRLCNWLNQDLDKAKKQEIESLIAEINSKDNISDATRADYRRCVKQFYKWYIKEDTRLTNPNLVIDDIELIRLAKGDDSNFTNIMLKKKQAEKDKQDAQKLYEYVSEIKRSYKLIQIDPSEVLTDDDIQLVLDKGCNTPKEKAFIALLHETGARIGEFLNIKIKDITLEGNFMSINLDGKTGKRTVFCYTSMPYLIKYLEVHKQRNDSSAYLWLSNSHIRQKKKQVYAGANHIINRCFKNAGLNKKHNAHWFRHSRATIFANKITEPQLRKFMGWSKDSRMIKHYGHLSTKDIQNVILQINGVEQEDKKKDEPIKCICGTLNPRHERYCYKCYRPLKLETVMQDQELAKSELGKTISAMMDMMKDPEMMKKFEDFKKNRQEA